MTVEVSKISIDTDYDSLCGGDTIELSQEFIISKSFNGTQLMDCTSILTESNLYILSRQSLHEYESIDHNTLFVSNFVLFDVTPANQSASSPLSSLTTTTSADTNTWISECDLIIVHFNHSNSSFFATSYDASSFEYFHLD